MRIRYNSLITAAIIVLSTGLSLYAQSQKPDGQNTKERNERYIVTEKLNFARSQIVAKNYEGAAAFLETVYETYPKNIQVIITLKQCYDYLRYYPKTEEMIRRYLIDKPNDITYRIYYAESIARQGRLGEAVIEYKKAGALVKPVERHRFQSLTNSMIKNELGDSALTLIDQWRVTFDDTLMLSVQKGKILERQEKYGDAAVEYVKILSDSVQYGRMAQSRLVEMLKFEDSRPETETHLLIMIHQNSHLKAATLLSDYYLQAGRLEDAFQLVTASDSLDQLNVGKLYFFMQNSFDRKQYELAVRVGDYIFENIKESRFLPAVSFTYAGALSKLERYNEAITVYENIYARNTSPRDQSEALYMIADNYLEYLNDYSNAIIYYDSLFKFFPRTNFARRVPSRKAHCNLRQGKLKQAYSTFKNASENNPHPDDREELVYYQALVKFFQKDKDSCRLGLNKLIVDFPRGFYFNDAMSLLMVLDDAEGADDVLYDYSNAMLFETMKNYDSTGYYLNKVAANPKKILVDISLMKLSELERNRNDIDAALVYLDKIVNEYPESYYFPFALKIKADILIDNPEDSDALEIYRRLLTDFPNYPFIEEVRIKLRHLKESDGSA